MRLFPSVLLVFYVSLSAAIAQETATSCAIYGPPYSLSSDSVNWTMTLASGQACLRGLRANLTTIDEIKLITPPKYGRVTVEGPGFLYKGDPGFLGQDSFSFEVAGKVNRVKGSSKINILVSVR
jgi:hypothetical protein